MRSNYPVRVLIAVDQLVNALLGGDPDETLSARAWRLEGQTKRWKVTRIFIDTLFFLQPSHCKQAYESEVNNAHLASIYSAEQDLKYKGEK